MTLRFVQILFLGLFSGFLLAQAPGDREDAETERRKILRAADLVDSIQVQQEQFQSRITDLEARLKGITEKCENLLTENQKLRGDLATLKSGLEKSEESRIKEREVLLKEIGSLISEKTKNVPSSHDALLKVREEETKKTSESTSPEKPESGFYYTVQKGDTLSAIADAYKANGVNITIQDIRDANKLTKKDVIRTGQKLFIPKK